MLTICPKTQTGIITKFICKLHASSAINAQNLSVDPFAILAGKEAHNTSNINWETDSVERRPSGGVLIDTIIGQLLSSGNVLSANLVVHVGLNSTRSNAVDGDLLVTEVNRHASHESLNGTLATRVDSVLGNTLGLTSDGSHHDETATNRQVFVCLAGNEELSSSVDAHDTVVLLLSDILDVAERNDTRVRADNIELSEMSNGLSEQRNNVLDNRDVGHDCDGFASGLDDLGNDLISCLGAVGVVDNNLCASASQLKRFRDRFLVLNP